ncbi:hypothetical protein [Tsukamurella sp. PLM1]|uniref:hypothetical protein n=1 Tax=Tsukamurella sp. PLM1 TaxID=2929795 RepID=UPI0020691776|nr:hypothetical protein [Tsukamurella sp. PLM1]BDH55082.1 hypothetical protein MTP03_00210 [Tsukamurella sp. PLM1]
MTPTPPAQPVAEQSWITTYGPLLIASVALLSAILALLGVWLNNHYAAKRQRADLRAAVRRQNKEIAAAEVRRKKDVTEAEQRRVRDAAAIDERELARHRRERLAVKLSDYLAAALGVVPPAVLLHNYRVRLAEGTAEANTALQQMFAREMQGYENEVQANLAQITSLNYQIQMLAPPDSLTDALDHVALACGQLRLAAQLGGAPPEVARERRSAVAIPEFDDGTHAVKAAVDRVVVEYREMYGLVGTIPGSLAEES